MAKQYIKIRGANEHNLKNISIDIPRNELVVLTGLSGSGKSSLAFDTIYAEGQRRYMESLSSYARQFLGQMEKPDVESIEGLSPAISIDQKSTNRNPRSTVGTVTEIYDYMRLLYARIGIPHCPKCGREIRRQTVDQMVDQIMALPERTKIQLLAPVVRGRKGRHEKVLEQAKKSGYVRVRVDGSLYELSEEITLQMQHYAEEVARVLGLNTYSRTDFLLNEKNEIFCLEANTLPGMTPTSLLPQEAAVLGIDFNSLCEKLIQVSLEKYEQ